MSDPQEAATPAGHELRQMPPWPPSPDATYMLTRMQCSCGWGTGVVKDVRGNPDLDRMRERAADHVAESALVAATPSDPHSAEADLPPKRSQEAAERYPFDGWDPAIRILQRSAFDAGRVSRDAEVAELKAKIADAWDEGYAARVDWDSYSLRYVNRAASNPYRSASPTAHQFLMRSGPPESEPGRIRFDFTVA